MKRIIYFLIVSMLTVSFLSGVAMADDHSKSQVNRIIAKVVSKLDKIRDHNGDSYAGREIGKIESYVKSAKMQLDDGEEDLAFYEIEKAKSYFDLIAAKKEFAETQKLFNASKRRK